MSRYLVRVLNHRGWISNVWITASSTHEARALAEAYGAFKGIVETRSL